MARGLGHLLLECLDKASELLVHRGDLTEIGFLAIPRRKRLGRGVRRVRIEVVNPHEPGFRPWLLQVLDGAICRRH